MKNNDKSKCFEQTQITTAIAAMCHELKLPSFFQAYMDQMKDPAFAEMAFPDRLHPMLKAEVVSRSEKRLARNYKESGINDALPSLDRMIYDNDRGLRKALIDDLATCNWMRLENGPLNILVTGMAGTGKTWLVKSLGKAALEHGYRVLYMRAPQLVEKLRLARQDNEPAKLRNRLNSKDLLIIEDFAMTPLDEATKDDLLSLIDERQGRASMMVASQRPLSQWCEYLGSGLHADAIVDRLRNTSYRIALKGRSLRENTEIAKKLKEVEEE